MGAAVGWGLLYGLMWWFIGPLTLEPILLGQSFTWTTVAADGALASLIGHMLYGASMASVFFLQERRHDDRLRLDRRPLAARRENGGRLPAVTTPAPAAWLFVLGLGIVLPLLLG
jgi:hypothetical protein